MAMSRNDYERIAGAFAGETYHGEDFDPACHARYVAVIGISCRAVNERFDAGKFATWSKVDDAYMTRVVDAIDAKSMRVFDAKP